MGGSTQPQEPTELEEDKDKIRRKLEELKMHHKNELQRHPEEKSRKKTEEISPHETFEYEQSPIVFKLNESDKKILRGTPLLSGMFPIEKSAIKVGNNEGF